MPRASRYRESVLPPAVTARVSVEQASTFGWERYVGVDGQAHRHADVRRVGAAEGPAEEVRLHPRTRRGCRQGAAAGETCHDDRRTGPGVGAERLRGSVSVPAGRPRRSSRPSANVSGTSACTSTGCQRRRRPRRLARQEGIPLLTLAEAGILDLTVDGADEVDPNLDLIKGYGRALVREKIVAASSRRLVILVGDEKLVPQLGTRGKLPVEVTPFALPLCERRLGELGCRPVPYVWAIACL